MTEYPYQAAIVGNENLPDMRGGFSFLGEGEAPCLIQKKRQ